MPMALTDRTAALAPYAQQLLYNRDLQASAQEATQAVRAAYRRARGKDAPDIARDKKVRRQVDKAVAAIGSFLAELQKPPPKAKPRRAPRLVALALLAAMAVVIANENLRARLLGLLRDGDESSDTTRAVEVSAAAGPATPPDQNGDSVG
jgi:hypothetical protein